MTYFKANLMEHPGPHPPFSLSLCVWLLNYWCLCIADFSLCFVPDEYSCEADRGIHLTQKVGLYSSSCPHTARPSLWIWPQHCGAERRTLFQTQDPILSLTTECMYRDVQSASCFTVNSKLQESVINETVMLKVNN